MTAAGQVLTRSRQRQLAEVLTSEGARIFRNASNAECARHLTAIEE
jgi:hypothetical protein